MVSTAKKTIVLMLFAIFFSLFLTAQASAEFTATSSEEINVCSCSLTSESIFVSNTGSSTEAYRVSQNLDFVDAAKKNFILQPGETEELVMIINPVCGDVNTYTLKTTISTFTNDEKTLTQKINIGNCRDFEALISSPTTAVCGNLQQNLTITNKEPSGTRDYTVKGNGVSDQRATIRAGESSNIALRPAMQCNLDKKTAFVTEYLVTNSFTSKTLRSRIIIAPPSAAYQLQITPTKARITYNKTSFFVKFKNVGEFGNTYLLDVSDADVNGRMQRIASLDKGSIRLSPGEEEKSLMSVDTSNLEEGKYKVNVTAITQENPIKYYQETEIELKKTLSEKIKEWWNKNIEPRKWPILWILLLLLLLLLLFWLFGKMNKKRQEKLKEEMEEGKAGEYAEIKGNKAHKENLNIPAGGSEQVVIAHEEIPITKIIIQTKKRLKNASLTIERNDNLPSVYEGTEGKNAYLPVRIGKTNLNDEDLEKIFVRFRISKEWARKNKLKINRVYLSRYRKKWEHYKAKRKGENENWLYYEAEIPGFSWFVIGNAYGAFQLPAEKEKKEATIPAKAQSKKELKAAAIIKAPKQVKKEPEKKPLTKKEKEEKRKRWGWLFFWLAMLLLLLIALLATYYDSKQEKKQPEDVQAILKFIKENNLEGENYIVINKNEKVDLNLNKYFKDPDNDKLEYRVIDAPDNISVTINGNIATIAPERDFVGVRKATFFASDGVDFAVSDEFIIVVKN